MNEWHSLLLLVYTMSAPNTMSATRAPKTFDTPHLTPPPSDGRAMEFCQFLNKQLPFMKQEMLLKEFFMKLVPFSTEKAQQLLDKLKDNTLYDGKCWPSLCVAKAQTEQKKQEEQKTQAEQRTKKTQKMQKQPKKVEGIRDA